MDQRPTWYKRLNDYPFERKTFNQNNIIQIERELKNRKRQKNKSIAWYVGTGVIALTIIAVFMVSSKFNESAKTNAKIQAATEPITVIPTPTPDPNTSDKLSTKNIFERMLNSMDFFKNVEGVYHVKNIITEEAYTVEFLIDESDRPGSYIVRKGDGTKSKSTISIADGTHRLEVFPGKNEISYRKELINKETNFIDSDKARFYRDKNGEMTWVTRGDVASAFDRAEMIFPQSYAFWMVDENSLQPNYKVLGNETIAGREAVILSGQLKANIGERQAKSYKYWVDTKTGVMLKMTLIDKENMPVVVMEMTTISFDKGNIDRSKFSTQPKVGWIELKKSERSP